MSVPRQSAVVFGYHSVGTRALTALIDLGVDVRLLVTHDHDPAETQWFENIRDVADWEGIPWVTPNDPNDRATLGHVQAVAPDWIFSFYYRRMLSPELLAIPPRGAYNLHGSLLPKYRGRVPVNWAVLHGEQETGMSLHRMVRKPDAGAVVDHERVPILTNDTAYGVFQRLVCAGEILLLRAVPRMLAGTHRETPLDLGVGSYFGGRRPEDGRIDWRWPCWQVHNLIRAVAPPYPGAFFDYAGVRIEVLGSWYRNDAPAGGARPRIYWEDNDCFADCLDGQRLRLTRIECDGTPLNVKRATRLFGRAEISLDGDLRVDA
ncbi:MAG: formyltransferase [Thiohalocapsa sp.]